MFNSKCWHPVHVNHHKGYISLGLLATLATEKVHSGPAAHLFKVLQLNRDVNSANYVNKSIKWQGK